MVAQSQNPHILMLSPPLDLRPEWFAPHLPYSLSKFGMSIVALGLAEEFRSGHRLQWALASNYNRDSRRRHASVGRAPCDVLVNPRSLLTPRTKCFAVDARQNYWPFPAR
jgi:hypothetical protein